MKTATKVLSTRVPLDVYNQFQRQATKSGLSVNALLKSKVTGEQVDNVLMPKYANGGDVSLPSEIEELLIGLGAISVGALVYKAVSINLEDKNTYTQEEILLYSSISAVAVGLVTGWGINKLMSIYNSK
jgi:hypothetical protein